ncbi:MULTISPECIES: rod-binding protein [Bosea]|jgi:Rod binding domain-containing protein|uniref:Rod-binding protein n=1 Tax=Bosea rubneri TaxID=3075434 RepID=A0ABU3S4H0_9HYPH|nr:MULTISPECIES: rod-binding protein [unclassified Bosea (in: a-proteobacteria)]MDU0339674.1 rod-binding protein [Bosea sp. ZW T0_25]HEV7337372.1 rod-binding protein [Bosea sp. (in: a-proteobacteria)]
MSAALAIPAAKLALGAAANIAHGIASAFDGSKAAKAKKTADEFETVFLENFTKSVMDSSGTEGPLGENGTGGEVYRSMLTQEYARHLQKAGGLGLSDQILRDLIQVQAKASGTNAGGGHAG